MNCLEVQAKLLDFIDCQLNESEKQLLEQHLMICKECSKQHLEWKETILNIQETKDNISTMAASTSIKNNVMKRIELYEGNKRAFKRNIKVWNRLASIAAVFAIMFIGYAGYNHNIDTEQPNLSVAIEQHNMVDLTEKKGDVVRIASNDETMTLSNHSIKNVAPYSLGGLFFGIGAVSIVMRRKIEKQLSDLLK